MTPPRQIAEKPDFSFLDQSSFRARYSEDGHGRKMRFYVAGIRCAKCLRAIEGLGSSTPGLNQIRVEMDKHLVHVEFDPEILSASAIASAITELGFKVRPLTPDSSAELAMRQEDRQDLIRLAVAGACFGNIMGFAIAIYLGGDGPWVRLFSWLSFAAYLPVLTFVAWPFYVGAWSSLRLRKISIDLPMAVASLAGFLFSTVQLINGHTDFYFDSTSGFLFLILLARFFQKRLQRRYLNVSAPPEELQRVRRLSGKNWDWYPTENLTPGDEILVQAGETLPVDAELKSQRAHVSLAWLTGESKPRLYLSGATVPAGAQIKSDAVHFGFLRPLGETAFGQTLDEVRRFALAGNRAISLADRWTQWLLGTVFTVAIGFLVFYWPTSPDEAIHRSLALIVIACPCAMAFGTPLAMAYSLRRAAASGLLISDANVFTAAARAKNFFFDKTGTLTELDLTLVRSRPEISPVYQKIILALENQSHHPMAFAFRKAFTDFGRLPPVASLTESPGVGVSGYVFGKHYCLRANPEASGESLSCALFEDEHPILRFEFEVGLKPDVLHVLTNLREQGFKVKMLSGDRRESTDRLAAQLGFAPEDTLGDLKPEQKAALVSSTPDSIMIGDGVNDALALMRASVGVAVAGAVGTALKSASVYLNTERLTSLLDLIKISREGNQLMRQNLTISLIYNCIGATLALTGFVNPLVAAILMPISSSLVLLNTWRWGRR